MILLLYLNDVAGSSVGVVVEHRPPRPIPRRKVLAFDVPGRTGKLIRELDAWDNVTLTYELAVVPPPGVALSDAADRAVAWLTQSAPIRLYDDTDPGVFYSVACPGGKDLTPILHTGRRVKIAFDADPRRFLLTGERPVTVSGGSSVTLSNPTPYAAQPLVRLSGSGAGSLAVGAATLTFSQASGLVIDCDSRTATGSVSAAGNVWPALGAGDTFITLTGSGLSAEILPRWYML